MKRLKRAIEIFWTTLREIFDENAYARFLRRKADGFICPGLFATFVANANVTSSPSTMLLELDADLRGLIIIRRLELWLPTTWT